VSTRDRAIVRNLKTLREQQFSESGTHIASWIGSFKEKAKYRGAKEESKLGRSGEKKSQRKGESGGGSRRVLGHAEGQNGKKWSHVTTGKKT